MVFESECPTYVVKLYVSGVYDRIVSVCQDYCLQGLCVSIKKIDYTFKMGNCSGAEVTFINYPRFPSDLESIVASAKKLGKLITLNCSQGSFTLVSPDKTYFWSRRDEDMNEQNQT